ncbi:hypothetical protein SETIT_3G294000v2 [Setaria italica]|uniref:Uncharacterized protein n=1 Tax=Setaria italica TaxID=4555 RepID=A0A368QK52_SETIT|nr:hypothetical protein SETIT_3G294000v2 [Setaria italica]
MAYPSSEGRSRSYGQISSIPSSSFVGSYCSEKSSCDTTRWHPESKCDHGLRAVVKYSWTFLNLGCWHNVKLTHVLLALFVVVVGSMLNGKAK